MDVARALGRRVAHRRPLFEEALHRVVQREGLLTLLDRRGRAHSRRPTRFAGTGRKKRSVSFRAPLPVGRSLRLRLRTTQKKHRTQE